MNEPSREEKTAVRKGNQKFDEFHTHFVFL